MLSGILGLGGRKRFPVSYLLVYVILVVLAVFALNTDVVQRTIARATNIDLVNVNTAGGARFRGYIQFGLLNWWYKIVGMGYGSTPETAVATWFSGASYMLYGPGIIGFMVCLTMLYKLFKRGQSISAKVLCIMFTVLFFVDDSFMSHVSVLYLTLICLADDTQESGRVEYSREAIEEL